MNSPTAPKNSASLPLQFPTGGIPSQEARYWNFSFGFQLASHSWDYVQGKYRREKGEYVSSFVNTGPQPCLNTAHQNECLARPFPSGFILRKQTLQDHRLFIVPSHNQKEHITETRLSFIPSPPLLLRQRKRQIDHHKQATLHSFSKKLIPSLTEHREI